MDNQHIKYSSLLFLLLKNIDYWIDKKRLLILLHNYYQSKLLIIEKKKFINFIKLSFRFKMWYYLYKFERFNHLITRGRL